MTKQLALTFAIAALLSLPACGCKCTKSKESTETSVDAQQACTDDTCKSCDTK